MSESSTGNVVEMPAAGDLMRKWAKFYVNTLGWAVAPCWLAADGAGGMVCLCPEGEGCPWPGKHLVDARRVVRPSQTVDDKVADAENQAAVLAVWSSDHPDMAAGKWGIACLCGSESQVLVWDVPAGVDVPGEWLGGRGSLVARTPSNGKHWFFRLDPKEAVGSVGAGGLSAGGSVLADGAYVALYPRSGYSWAGGMAELKDGMEMLAPVPVGLRMVLEMAGVLVQGVADVHEDDPWRCMAGAGLAGSVARSYKRVGDVRRFVDLWGHRVRWTPGGRGGGWAWWSSADGWIVGEAAETAIVAVITDGLVAAVRAEGAEARRNGRGDDAQRAIAWANSMGKRVSGFVKVDLHGDPRIVVSGPGAWNREKDVVGLPMVDGVGRVVELGTGAVVAGARERLVSRKLGVGVVGGAEAWARSVATRKYLGDLERVHGADWMRLLQRAAGMTLFGAGGLEKVLREQRARGGAGAAVVLLRGGVDMVFVLAGAGRSGKSTFLETLDAVMGDYSAAMSQNLLFGNKGNKDFSIAAIEGARMLYTSEPPADEALDVPLLKSLSGGDSLTGRGVHQRSERTFVPDCTIWIATNHHIKHADEALWERMKIFEFRSDYSGGAGESWVREMMKTEEVEKEAFLWWVLQGVAGLVESGWGDTGVWDRAVEGVKLSMDPVARFISERLSVVVGGGSRLAMVEAAWEDWMMTAGVMDKKLTRDYVMQEVRQRVGRMGVNWDQKTRSFVNLEVKSGLA